MNTHDDLLNCNADMCSLCGNDVSDMCSKDGHDTYRVRNNATKERYVKLLDFRHFERHMMFSQSDRKEKKKAISDGVNVSVVMEL